MNKKGLRKVAEGWLLLFDDSDYPKALAESTPRRLQAMLGNGGNATKYLKGFVSVSCERLYRGPGFSRGRIIQLHASL